MVPYKTPATIEASNDKYKSKVKSPPYLDGINKIILLSCPFNVLLRGLSGKARKKSEVGRQKAEGKGQGISLSGYRGAGHQVIRESGN
jgi:hypothetical protein